MTASVPYEVFWENTLVYSLPTLCHRQQIAGVVQVFCYEYSEHPDGSYCALSSFWQDLLWYQYRDYDQHTKGCNNIVSWKRKYSYEYYAFHLAWLVVVYVWVAISSSDNSGDKTRFKARVVEESTSGESGRKGGASAMSLRSSILLSSASLSHSTKEKKVVKIGNKQLKAATLGS